MKPFTFWLADVVKTDYVSLPNLLAGEIERVIAGRGVQNWLRRCSHPLLNGKPAMRCDTFRELHQRIPHADEQAHKPFWS